jgi:predicted alpha/beta-hydrolase family hydrolase
VTRRAPRPPGLLLTPGAGADRTQVALVAIDQVLTAAGAVVERMDFPYRLAGRRAPDRTPVLVEAVRQGAAALRPRVGRLALGGRSMGGRMCSMAVAEGLAADGLVLISYPLHPPGKPDRLRTEHFEALKVPCLFVSGTRDAFGRPEELEAATRAIPGPVTHHWIEGGDHGLRRGDAAVARFVAEWFSEQIGPLRPPAGDLEGQPRS